MKKVLSKKEWVLWLLTLTPSIVMFWMWESIPSIIPTHYNLFGEADDWGEKNMLQWLIPGLCIFMYLLLLIIPLIDPKHRLNEMGVNISAYDLLCSALSAIFSL